MGHIKKHWKDPTSQRKCSDETDSTSDDSSSFALASFLKDEEPCFQPTPTTLFPALCSTNSGLRCASQKLSKSAITKTPLNHVPYVHGGYAAAAPLFVNDCHWMNLLKRLMPKAYEQVIEYTSTYTTSASIPILMKWAEHNPLVAAYGVLQGQPYRYPSQSTAPSRIRTKEPNITAIEWDVFLDPYLVKKIDQAVEKAATDNNPFAQLEVDALVERLMTRMVLAHGSASQLLTEAIGVAPNFNFAQVAAQSINKSNTSSSAIFVTNWLRLFLAALKHETQQEEHHTYSNTSMYITDNRTQDKMSSFCCGLLLCINNDADNNINGTNNEDDDMVANLQEIKEIFGGKPLRVVLDLKSRRVPPRIWARLIDSLFSRGLFVEAIGSFDVKELRAIIQETSTPVTPMIFFHSAGDLQRACHSKEILRGDTVYFNGGSLLWQKPSVLDVAQSSCGCFPQKLTASDSDDSGLAILPFAYPKSSLNDDVSPHFGITTSSIEEYKKYYGLNIGLYVQEFSIGQDALEILINFVNFYSEIYNLGMAYGGLNGATIPGMAGDGFWNQRYIGRNWDAKSGPTDYLEPSVVEDNEMMYAIGALGAIYEPDDTIGNALAQSASCSQQIPFENARFV